jgi:hypothetical protein
MSAIRRYVWADHPDRDTSKRRRIQQTCSLQVQLAQRPEGCGIKLGSCRLVQNAIDYSQGMLRRNDQRI